ncbi:MAG TPA: hypothetical protein VG433_06505, partial [Pirellulales bacterium]|nr:hypothetical protein [Pirellulales bacterium]
WLMEDATVPSVNDAREKAVELLGADSLARALDSPAISSQIDADGTLYDLAGHGPIPKLMTPQFVITGQPKSAQQLFDVLEKQGGLEPLVLPAE